jgi:hypothetical protein
MTHRGRFGAIAACAMLPAIVIACAGLVLSGATTGAGVAVGSFGFVFDGRHVPATIPSESGVMHVGTFTASAPFCASGTVADLEFYGPGAVRRSYICGDGTGTMFVRSSTPRFEHVSGGSGSWEILGGTGQYASLRGRGTWTSVHLGGDQDDYGTITFRSTSGGVADLDAVAPQIVVSRSSATRLPRPVGVYLVRLAFSARDNVAANVSSYQVTIKAGATDLAFRRGATVAGTASLTLRVRPPKGSRRIQIVIAASDPLGNERKQVRLLTLRP